MLILHAYHDVRVSQLHAHQHHTHALSRHNYPQCREVEPLSAAAASLAARPAHTHTSDSSFLPWVEKYRPNSLDDLISQGDIINTSTWRALLTLRRRPPLPTDDKKADLVVDAKAVTTMQIPICYTR